MNKKKTLADIMPASGGASAGSRDGFERDLVTLYSRLTHTLENACGRDALARRLADERRHAASGPEAAERTFSPALSRAFRRIGLVGHGHNADAFAADFFHHVGLAVSRPVAQVARMFRLFVGGDDGMGLKPVCGATPQCQICLLTRECDHFNTPRKPEMAALPPAARVMSGNGDALSDAELLGVVLFGEKGTGQEELVTTILARYGRLLAASRAEAHEFQGIRGMTRPQALRLAAMNVWHGRILSERRGAMLRIGSAADIHARYAPELRDLRTEAAVLLLLDAQNNVIRDAWFQGESPTAARLPIADLLRPAVREYAARVALVHNHPANDPQPSMADLDFTRRLRSACDTIGIGLVDHVIVADSGYYSFAENGMLGV